MRRWLEDERGATSIEYALIAGLVFVAIVSGVAAIGTPLKTIFGKVVSGIGI